MNGYKLSVRRDRIIVAYQSQRLRLGKLFVNFLGEVLVRLEDLDVGHGGGSGGVEVGWGLNNESIVMPQSTQDGGIGRIDDGRSRMELLLLRLDV